MCGWPGREEGKSGWARAGCWAQIKARPVREGEGFVSGASSTHARFRVSTEIP